MNDEPDISGDDPRVLALAREYLAELEAGKIPQRKNFIERCPDLAEELGECFDGIELAQAMRPMSRTDPLAELTQSPEPLGDFQIVRQIARGGMGVVYEAIQLSLGRRVALKVLPFAAALDQRQLQRFKIEAHAAAQLHHSNIVPIYAVGCDRGVHYYAMQLIKGQSLGELLNEWRGENSESAAQSVSPIKTPRSTETAAVARSETAGPKKSRWKTAARIIAEVADALDFAHVAGVIHRDIKPANILIDEQGRVWVTDFGLAQVATDVSLTRSGEMLGTLRYMSPEQAMGQRAQVDHRSDIYSLGATLYELLTLKPIFSGDDRATLLLQILQEEPNLPRQHDRTIPIELETIVLKAIAKSPADRYATAGEFAEDLRRFLSERPILARRPTWLDHTRKWLRRHPGFLVAVGLIGLISAIVMAIATTKVWHEQRLTSQSLERERLRSVQAESRLIMAQRAADELIQLAEDEALDHPFQEGLRTRLLETALQYYQEFIDERHGHPEDQAILEATRDRVEKILDDLALLRADRQFFLLREENVLDDLQATAAQRTELKRVLGDLTVFSRPGSYGTPEPPKDGPPRMTAQKDGPPRGGRSRNDQDDRDPPAQRRPSTEPLMQPYAQRPFISRESLIEIARQHEKKLTSILQDSQLLRLNQIALQMQGPDAFRDYEVVKQLELTRDQQADIRKILVPRGPLGRERPRQQRTVSGDGQQNQVIWEDIFKLLTQSQFEKWQAMIGEPFDPEPVFGERVRNR
ncbi:MAG: serine/threonine protein kinase [Pirellulaceae bacterium]|nr:serine/threonine protein kinase [Pirellulaceae bacterium]